MLDAGAWTVCDPARVYTLELERNAHVLLLLMARAQCPGWLPALPVLAARALPAGGPVQIARAALAAMLREVAGLDADSEATLHDAVVALVGQALTLALAEQGLTAERVLQLRQVQAYIQHHLAQRALTVERVAAAFGVSRRSLYNLFVPSGVTPHAFIRNAKLDRACQLLNRPGARGASVAQIGHQCGFADPAHFSRAFHARHGLAPKAWREASA